MSRVGGLHDTGGEESRLQRCRQYRRRSVVRCSPRRWSDTRGRSGERRRRAQGEGDGSGPPRVRTIMACCVAGAAASREAAAARRKEATGGGADEQRRGKGGARWRFCNDSIKRRGGCVRGGRRRSSWTDVADVVGVQRREEERSKGDDDDAGLGVAFFLFEEAGNFVACGREGGREVFFHNKRRPRELRGGETRHGRRRRTRRKRK
mmetsp:Transcript_17602/g.53652  ORF Transcript_17602/g.53652 Transcript_17602/m.53652 type:complete len:207 (+) Transcript_17602:898-1518(+)